MERARTARAPTAPPRPQRPGILAAATIALLLAWLPAVAQPDNRRTVAAMDASSLRAWDRVVDLELRAGGLRRYDAQPNPYLPDRRTERFAQHHEGVPVYGADLVRQTEGGVTTAILGTLFTGIDVDAAPGLTPSEARAAFAAMSAPPFGLAGSPSLRVLPLDDGEYTLAWQGTLSSFRDVFIDAGSGEALFEVSRIRHQAVGLGTGVLGDERKMATESIGGLFRTRDSLRPAVIRTYDMGSDENRFLNALVALRNGAALAPTALAADGDNVWEDPAVVDVHAGLGWSYDYLATQLGWAGIDGRNGDITAFVHPVNAARVMTTVRECLRNPTDRLKCLSYFFLQFAVDNAAYFYPTPGVTGSTGFLVFGEPFLRTKPVTALDIAGHELAHGVNYFTARLLGSPTPPNEPGALSEAFSDIIGTATEFHIEEPGEGPLRADYLIGEDVGFPLRSLRDPRELFDALIGRPYPDHYDHLYRGEKDNGGEHFNATILGHAYFLAVEGGTNRTSGLSVAGVGHENRLDIERTFFNAWVNLVPSFADHAIVRESLIRSAVDLFGPDAATTRAIREALAAVGIPRASGQVHTFNQGCHDSGDCQ